MKTPALLTSVSIRPKRPSACSTTCSAVRGSAAEALAEARRRGAATHLVPAVTGKAALLDALADTLAFPGWVGRNWDALADALGDLSWLPAGPVAVVWLAPHQLRDADPAAYEVALDVLREAAESSAGTAHPLTVLLVRAE